MSATGAGSKPDLLAFERVRLPSGITLHLNSTPKLKTIVIKASLAGDLDATVTRRALLPMILRRGTRRFPDMRSLHRHLENLYGTILLGDVGKIGEWHLAKFHLELVNDRFLPGREDVLRDALIFFRELLLDPHLPGGAFDPAFLEEEKNNLRRTLEGLIDDKAQYAMEACVRAMCPREEYRRHDLGDLAEIPSIAPGDLTAFYRGWIERSPIDIYVSGDLEIARVRDLFFELFDAKRPAAAPLRPIPPPVPVGEVRRVEERMEVNQGKLILGYRHGVTYGSGDVEAMTMLNGILGTFSHSKLFQNVREKASLAYDIHSALEKTKGLLFIAGGIAVENCERALEIIRAQIAALERGEISDDELLSTRESYLDGLSMMEDNPGELMTVDRVWRLHGRAFDLHAYREALRAVDRERIQAAARLLKLDTIYLLRN